MVRKFKVFALTGALLMAASPAFAQDPMGDMMKGMGDLDPMHILSPAPAAAPAAAPPARKMHRHHMMRHHAMKHKMMGKKMMKKPMMKKM